MNMYNSGVPREATLSALKLQSRKPRLVATFTFLGLHYTRMLYMPFLAEAATLRSAWLG